jgi:hypothetical protein
MCDRAFEDERKTMRCLSRRCSGYTPPPRLPVRERAEAEAAGPDGSNRAQLKKAQVDVGGALRACIQF